ncbi:MAG TPA: antibiotic biosynthesis monooxygenase [Polyangia bacterium]|nr:antibiotic biosynthesis monooxygenase [Polyangia bacterium]
MVVELAILKAKAGAAQQLADGLRAARPVLSRAAGYLGSVFYQGIEDPDTVVLHIEWETLEAHTEGFRQGPLFPEWRSHFGHLLAGPPEVTHHLPIAGP